MPSYTSKPPPQKKKKKKSRPKIGCSYPNIKFPSEYSRGLWGYSPPPPPPRRLVCLWKRAIKRRRGKWKEDDRREVKGREHKGNEGKDGRIGKTTARVARLLLLEGVSIHLHEREACTMATGVSSGWMGNVPPLIPLDTFLKTQTWAAENPACISSNRGLNIFLM